MSNAFSNAWSWSLRHSPLLALWRSLRGIGRPNKDAFELLKVARLPEPVHAIIRTTVTRTKLWRDEREQIARELIAHAQDALDSGRTPEQVVEHFGDPRRVARLLRRSMKRKRPLAWQAYRFSRRAVGVVILVLIFGYGWLAVRFYTSEPEIRVNYAAQLAERNEGYREDQKSWPIIAEAGFEWEKVRHTLREQQEARVRGVEPEVDQPGIDLIPTLDPAHTDYASVADAVRSFEPHLARVRAAATRPVFGLPVGYEIKSVEWQGMSLMRDIVPADEDDFLTHSTIEMLLPNLGPTRALANLLVFDARLALSEGDAPRAIDDYIAAMHLARQCNNEPFLISRLIGIAIHHVCMNEIQQMVRAHPDVLDRDNLARLAHTHARLADQPGMGLESERYSFPDIIQRIYSDDGDGSGHMTAEGLKWMQHFGLVPTQYARTTASDVIAASQSLRAVSMPLSVVTSNDRATELALHAELFDRIQNTIDRGPEWVALGRNIDSEIEMQKVHSQELPMRYSLVAIMMPALGQVANRYYSHRQHENAFSLMLGIESYRRATGELPELLSVLEPHYLPAVPEDLMDPGQLIKYLRSDDGYIVYSVGSDGDDDHGVSPTPSNEQYNRNPESQFGLRFTQSSDPITGEPLLEPGGKPKLDKPQGPDGDWILIDTRPQPDPEPADAS